MLDIVQMKPVQLTRSTRLRRSTAIRSICVYCGSSPTADAKYRLAAEDLGRGLAQAGIRMVYRGLPTGLLDVVIQAVLDDGGQVTGIVSTSVSDRLPVLQRGHRVMVVRDWQASVEDVFDAADAFVALPGGVETLTDLLDHVKAHKLRRPRKTVAVVDLGGFWQPLLRLMKTMQQDGFEHPSTDYDVCDTITDALALMQCDGPSTPRPRVVEPAPVGDGPQRWAWASQARDGDQPSDRGYETYDLN